MYFDAYVCFNCFILHALSNGTYKINVDGAVFEKINATELRAVIRDGAMEVIASSGFIKDSRDEGVIHGGSIGTFLFRVLRTLFVQEVHIGIKLNLLESCPSSD